jgi:hypothetical protein
MPRERPEEVACPECGSLLNLRQLRSVTPRSPKQHNAFFKMIDMGLRAWPESYSDFQPEGISDRDRYEHLRAWLIAKSGWRQIIGRPLEPGAGDAETTRFWAALLYAAQVEKKIVFRVEQNGKKFGVSPKSIAIGECDPVDFRTVFEEVKFLIESICGITIIFTPKEIRELKKDWGFEPKVSK